MVAQVWICKQTSKHRMEKHFIAQGQEIQRRAFCLQTDVNAVSGL